MLLLLAACTGPTPPLEPAPAPAPVPAPAPEVSAPAPPLLVLLVIDQLPIRTMDKLVSEDMLKGGLARLSQGYTAVARYPYVPTETCPGHAAISSGAAPDRTGIVANAWWNGSGMEYCVPPAMDASLLQAETLSDRVAAQQGRVVSLSIKDRAAIMLGGHQPTVVGWFDYANAKEPRGNGLEQLGTLPDWRCTGQRTWTVLSAEHQAAYASWFPDDQPFEPASRKLFPHEDDCGDARRFIGSPDAGRWLVDLAIQAQEKLALGMPREGAPGPSDLLAVSFSNIDVIGHTFTPDSWEMMDGLLRLDLELERLFTHLDGAVGAGNYAVMLSADHGATPGGASPLSEGLVIEAMKAAGVPESDDWALSDPWLWLPADITPEARTQTVQTLKQQLAGKDGILAVVDLTQPEGADPQLVQAVKLGHFPGRSSDLAVLRADGWQWVGANHKGPIIGTTHGSTDERDTRVPFWLWGAGVKPGKAAQDADIRQVAPTGAALLGLQPPKDAEAGALTEAISR